MVIGRRRQRTPLEALARGLVAGALGNAAFTAYQALQAKLGGDEGDASDRPPRDWSEAPEPAQVGQRVAEGVFEADVSPQKHASLLTHITHWVYGTSWGALYGMVQETLRPNPVAHGAALGGVVTATDYTLLPLMHVYEPPWRYSAKTIAKDLANHVVYGLAVAGAYRALDRVKD
jgi:hypothetical protein